MKHNDKIESLKEWEDTTKNQEFIYPMWFKHKNLGHVVRFDGLTVGEVVYGFENWLPDYVKSDNWTEHTDDSGWVQVPNPDLVTDKETEQEESKETLSNMIKQNGGVGNPNSKLEWIDFEDDNKAKNPNSKHYELWENFEAIDVIKLVLTEEEIDPELFIRTNGSCVEKAYKNNFKDYGFEGNFEGEILKEYENHFVGMVYQNEGNFGCSWDKKGKCLQAERFGYADMNLKLTEKEKFTYPMWFKDRLNGHIVEFTEDRVGTVVYSPTGSLYKIGYYSENWASHINDEDYYWQQVENPNLEIDSKEHKKDSSINNGGKTDYYQLKNAPFLIKDFDDFAEWRKMNGNQFNMGKAMWTFNIGRHSGTDYERDLNKIIHYANRELLRLKRGEK